MTQDDQLKTVRKKKKYFHSMDEIEKEFFPKEYARKQGGQKVSWRGVSESQMEAARIEEGREYSLRMSEEDDDMGDTTTTKQISVNETPDSISIGNSKTGEVKVYFDAKNPKEGEKKLEAAIEILLRHRAKVLGEQ